MITIHTAYMLPAPAVHLVQEVNHQGQGHRKVSSWMGGAKKSIPSSYPKPFMYGLKVLHFFLKIIIVFFRFNPMVSTSQMSVELG